MTDRLVLVDEVGEERERVPFIYPYDQRIAQQKKILEEFPGYKDDDYILVELLRPRLRFSLSISHPLIGHRLTWDRLHRGLDEIYESYATDAIREFLKNTAYISSITSSGITKGTKEEMKDREETVKRVIRDTFTRIQILESIKDEYDRVKEVSIAMTANYQKHVIMGFVGNFVRPYIEMIAQLSTFGAATTVTLKALSNFVKEDKKYERHIATRLTGGGDPVSTQNSGFRGNKPYQRDKPSVRVTCRYCGMKGGVKESHYPDYCPVIRSISERSAIVENKGWCKVCLCGHQGVHDQLKYTRKCYYCGSETHDRSLCITDKARCQRKDATKKR